MRKLILMTGLLPALASANPGMPGEIPPGGFGRPPMHHQPMGDAERLPPFLQDIGLSAQQQSEVKSLLKAHMSMTGDSRKSVHAVRMQLHQLSFSGAYTEEQAEALTEQLLAVHKTQALRQAQLDNAIYKLLTKEQQTEVEAQIAKMPADKSF